MSDDKSTVTLTGTIHAIPEPRSYGDKVYPYLVLEIDPGRYAQYPKLECRDTLSGLVANLGVGSSVKVYCNIRGREYTNKKTGEVDWFTSIQVFKLDVLERVARTGATGGGPDGPRPPDDPDQDIPFMSCSLDAEPTSVARAFRRTV